MMDWTFAKIRSWHVIRSNTTEPRTFCGRVVTSDASTSSVLPLNEKSCENCLRLTVYRTEGQ